MPPKPVPISMPNRPPSIRPPRRPPPMPPKRPGRRAPAALCAALPPGCVAWPGVIERCTGAALGAVLVAGAL